MKTYELLPTAKGYKIRLNRKGEFPLYVSKVNNGEYSWVTDYTYAKTFNEVTAREHIEKLEKEELQMAKNLAYIYKNSVVISNNEEEAREILKCPKNEKLLVEPAKAYHTPTLLATTSKEVRTNKKINMEYWDYIEAIIRSHLTACIEELKDWSVTDMKFGDSKEEENDVLKDIVDNLEKSIEYKIIADLQHWGGAEFPYVDEDA